MSYIKLAAHYVDQSGGRIAVGAWQLYITLNNGTTVDFPAPFVALDATLAVTPVIEPDGDAGVRVDFTRWSPLRYGVSGSTGFPVWLSSQELAVRVARAFDADPATRWSDSPDDIRTWLRSWAVTNDVPLTV
ncbi:hypothetical protein DMH03_23970 [Amycolatopsis sp. WAC 01376]|uniref:hypothetical protein n=1 Tax=Amycolatopsis sp. WAC 01376 TaxID=2203195 RepID=UPI000F77FBA7|nr:hypothetical protein [Amycolatopsis sp. WAC 01376]RSM58959.1 hypothetical protein DMH03_23970 [Amycolatopsis sp. WAC 01376]